MGHTGSAAVLTGSAVVVRLLSLAKAELQGDTATLLGTLELIGHITIENQPLLPEANANLQHVTWPHVGSRRFTAMDGPT